jgi:hypothetical protein
MSHNKDTRANSVYMYCVARLLRLGDLYLKIKCICVT